MDVLGHPDVGTPAERTAGTGEHHGAYPFVAARCTECVGQFPPQPGVDRVLALRPVQRQRADAVAVVGQQDRLIGSVHG
jgi:hypothetical protein